MDEDFGGDEQANDGWNGGFDDLDSGGEAQDTGGGESWDGGGYESWDGGASMDAAQPEPAASGEDNFWPAPVEAAKTVDDARTFGEMGYDAYQDFRGVEDAGGELSGWGSSMDVVGRGTSAVSAVMDGVDAGRAYDRGETGQGNGHLGTAMLEAGAVAAPVLGPAAAFTGMMVKGDESSQQQGIWGRDASNPQRNRTTFDAAADTTIGVYDSVRQAAGGGLLGTMAGYGAAIPTGIATNLGAATFDVGMGLVDTGKAIGRGAGSLWDWMTK